MLQIFFSCGVFNFYLQIGRFLLVIIDNFINIWDAMYVLHNGPQFLKAMNGEIDCRGNNFVNSICVKAENRQMQLVGNCFDYVTQEMFSIHSFQG